MKCTRTYVVLAVLVWVAGMASGDAERTVRGVMQDRPGAPERLVEVGVHEVPVDPPSVSAADAALADDECTPAASRTRRSPSISPKG